MVGECGTSRTGVIHRNYRCSTSKKQRACDKKTVKKDWMENLVVSKTMETLMNDKLMQDLSKRLFSLQQKENTTVPVFKKQLSDTQKAIENMLNAIQAGIFNESTKNRLDQLEEQKNQLEIAILQEQLQKPFLTKEQILFWLHKFRKMDMTDKAERQRLIDSFVQKTLACVKLVRTELNDTSLVYSYVVNGDDGSDDDGEKSDNGGLGIISFNLTEHFLKDKSMWKCYTIERLAALDTTQSHRYANRVIGIVSNMADDFPKELLVSWWA